MNTPLLFVATLYKSICKAVIVYVNFLVKAMRCMNKILCSSHALSNITLNVDLENFNDGYRYTDDIHFSRETAWLVNDRKDFD